ncbi:MAG: hypothetical protein HDT32_04110 [Clostridiales bacterium]|nr:hypothetical protein [Clostridiales bacterium]
MSRAKKAVLITFIVLLVLAVLILCIIWGILNSGYRPVQRQIPLDKLSTVMEDDIVYLSDDFLTVNNLQRAGFLWKDDDVNNVMIEYNGYKVNPNLSLPMRVKNIDSCVYFLSSKDDGEEIPMNISVHFYTSKDKNIKYDKEYNGYKYCVSVYNKKYDYIIKTTPRKGATCIVILTMAIKEDVAGSSYTEEMKIARMEQIFKSAVENIVYYNEL